MLLFPCPRSRSRFPWVYRYILSYNPQVISPIPIVQFHIGLLGCAWRRQKIFGIVFPRWLTHPLQWNQELHNNHGALWCHSCFGRICWSISKEWCRKFYRLFFKCNSYVNKCVFEVVLSHISLQVRNWYFFIAIGVYSEEGLEKCFHVFMWCLKRFQILWTSLLRIHQTVSSDIVLSYRLIILHKRHI